MKDKNPLFNSLQYKNRMQYLKSTIQFQEQEIRSLKSTISRLQRMNESILQQRNKLIVNKESWHNINYNKEIEILRKDYEQSKYKWQYQRIHNQQEIRVLMDKMVEDNHKIIELMRIHQADQHQIDSIKQQIKEKTSEAQTIKQQYQMAISTYQSTLIQVNLQQQQREQQIITSYIQQMQAKATQFQEKQYKFHSQIDILQKKVQIIGQENSKYQMEMGKLIGLLKGKSDIHGNSKAMQQGIQSAEDDSSYQETHKDLDYKKQKTKNISKDQSTSKDQPTSKDSNAITLYNDYLQLEIKYSKLQQENNNQRTTIENHTNHITSLEKTLIFLQNKYKTICTQQKHQQNQQKFIHEKLIEGYKHKQKHILIELNNLKKKQKSYTAHQLQLRHQIKSAKYQQGGLETSHVSQKQHYANQSTQNVSTGLQNISAIKKDACSFKQNSNGFCEDKHTNDKSNTSTINGTNLKDNNSSSNSHMKKKKSSHFESISLETSLRSEKQNDSACPRVSIFEVEDGSSKKIGKKVSPKKISAKKIGKNLRIKDLEVEEPYEDRKLLMIDLDTPCFEMNRVQSSKVIRKVVRIKK